MNALPAEAGAPDHTAPDRDESDRDVPEPDAPLERRAR
jgi:hypothetical protein